MENIALVEQSIIVEIKFDKTKLKEFKTERGLKNYLHNTTYNFLNKLKIFNNVDLRKVINTYNYDYVEINDFNYSANNQVPKTENHIVYRLFDFNLLGITENPKTNFINQIFNTKLFDIKISNCSYDCGKYR
jgi:hypothetical protein